MAATHLGGGDVSDIFDDLNGQIPNMFIFVYVQADNRIHSCTQAHMYNVYSSIHNMYKALGTAVVEDNLAIGMV